MTVEKCSAIMTAISIVITIFDVGTDWYTYYVYTQYSLPLFDVPSGACLVICILGTIFVVFQLLLILAVVCKPSLGSSKYFGCFWFISFLTSTFEDMAMVVNFLASSLAQVCRVVVHLRGYPGFVAVLMNGLSALWRVIHSYFSCCSDCKGERGCICCCVCCSWCWQVMQFPVQITTILCVVLTLKMNNPFIQGVPNTEIMATNVPIYLTQRILTTYPSGEDFCSHFHVGSQVIEFANISSLGSEAKVLRVPCSDIIPYYQGLFPSPHNDESQFNCNVVIVLFYNELKAEIRFDYGFEMRSVVFPHKCEPITRFAQSRDPDPGPLTSATKDAICKGNATCVEHVSQTAPKFDPDLYISLRDDLKVHDTCQVGVSRISYLAGYRPTVRSELSLCVNHTGLQKPNVKVDASIKYFNCPESCRPRTNTLRGLSTEKICNLKQI